jgi:hypothetical protein
MMSSLNRRTFLRGSALAAGATLTCTALAYGVGSDDASHCAARDRQARDPRAGMSGHIADVEFQ